VEGHGLGGRLVTAALLVATLAACGSGPASDPAAVRVADGQLRGTLTDGHRRFVGIPFAAPPVGPLRWRSPQPEQPWTGVRDATAPSEPCPQSFEREPDGRPRVTGSEDCLYLNVDTPSPAGGPLPVMVFLHGGGFVGGQGAPYDPARLTDTGRVVVVTLNYRLGALGFLAHPSLSDPAAGNFGLADQQAALRWVRANIAAFGGDPANVTLWGESAGAFSVCAQLAAPGARGLFAKAIVQSGPCGNPVLRRAVAEQRGAATAASLGCPHPDTAAACLRALPADRFVGIADDQVSRVHAAIAEVPWFPVAGTPLLPEQPIDAIHAGTAADVPLIHGGTADEMRPFVAGQYDLAGRPLTPEQYPQVVAELFGPTASVVLQHYPRTAFSSPGLALATLLTDYGGQVGACRRLLVDQARTRRAVTYAYEFAEPGRQPLGGLPPGAGHGDDVPYLFDSHFPGYQPPARTPAQQELATRLVRYWTTFARTDTPGPDWPPADTGTMLIASGRIGTIDLSAAHHCDFWRTVPAPS
jgi:para-nitrobenzyl esterase